MVVVTFQGEEGAYSEEAALAYFAARGMRNVETKACSTFEECFRLVENGDAHYAFVPIENTLQGTVDEAMDVLMASDLFIVGEMRFPIIHCLVGHPGGSVESVQKAFSHPYALMQSRDFLRARGIAGVPTSDTAGAVRELKARGNILEAAVASEFAAKKYGMEVLRKGIQSREDNQTRFIALSASEYAKPTTRKEAYVTSVVFGVRDQPAALHSALGVFAEREINLVKLESRPRKDKPWAYQFMLDFDGHRDEESVAEALSELVHNCQMVQILGSYPAWTSDA